MGSLLVLGVIGPAVFVLTFLVDGATRPGYRPLYHTVSALALGGRGWIQTANFTVCGVLIAVSALGIGATTGSVLWPAAVAVFGLGLVASGVFPMDPMRGYPPGAPDGDLDTTSRRHDLHDTAGAVVFGSLPAAAVLAALTLDDTVGAWSSGITAAALAPLLLAFGSGWEHDSPRTGLVQRATLVVGCAWLGTLCWYLARDPTV